MRKPEIKKLRLSENKGDQILIIDNMMTVNHNSKRDNYDLDLLQEVEFTKKPAQIPIIVIHEHGELTLTIGNRVKSIFFDSSDSETIDELFDFFSSKSNPDLELLDETFNDTRERPNPKGFKQKKNQLDFYKKKAPAKEIVDRNTVIFEPQSELRVIVIGNLMNLADDKNSTTYDLNKLFEFQRDDSRFIIQFKYQKSTIKELEIKFEDNQVLSDQFKGFLEYWKERNTFGK